MNTSSEPTPVYPVWLRRDLDVTSGYREVPPPQTRATFETNYPPPPPKVEKKKSWLRKFFWE